MSVIIFIIILSVLVFVHELGHFLVAKKSGVRVDEFGLGYPPRAKKLFSWKGTLFSLNWLPFGGFVKIFGEDPNETSENDPNSFTSKPRYTQASILVAGVIGNLLFALILISIGFMTGVAAPVNQGLPVQDAATTITTVLPGSPAAQGGIKSGDKVISVSRGGEVTENTPDAISKFISTSVTPLHFILDRGGEKIETDVTPATNLIAERPAVGISMDVIGKVKLPIHKAIYEGIKTTYLLTIETAKALGRFIWQAVRGKANLAAVTGPVGLVGMVGDVEKLGFSYLVTFTALISINLAIINLLPFPALDGGRLLFVGIEAIRRKAISPKIFNAVNTVGFALLILLMILVTVHDVRNIL
jgi:regulator of sigma E protease